MPRAPCSGSAGPGLRGGRASPRPAAASRPDGPPRLLDRPPPGAEASGARGIFLEFAFGPVPPRPPLCDTGLIERVLMNLVSNALKCAPEGGAVTVRIRAASRGETEFSVSDNGPGIPAEKLAALFQGPKKLGFADVRRSGYGLGLSICRKIVELHGGRIWAESAPGKGTRFVFRLPFRPPGRA